MILSFRYGVKKSKICSNDYYTDEKTVIKKQATFTSKNQREATHVCCLNIKVVVKLHCNKNIYKIQP
jgi:hypothetical protein